MKKIIVLILVLISVMSCDIAERAKEEMTRDVNIIGEWKHYELTELSEIYIGNDIFYSDGTFEESISGLYTRSGVYEFSDNYLIMEYDSGLTFQGIITESVLYNGFSIDSIPERKFIKVTNIFE